MKIENLTKKYEGTTALYGISLELEAGKTTAVLGESGAGKTTFLNCLAGLTSYEGSIDGRAGKKPARLANTSYLFQSEMLLPHLNAEQNLRLVLPKSEWNKIGDMLARVGLAGKEKSLPKELSGGERQRVAIARAFLYPHDVLLMDEPFSSLDLGLKKSMIELVSSLIAEKKTTVVFVTHDVREAVLLSDRAVVFQRGELVLDLPISLPRPRDFFTQSGEERRLVEALMSENPAS